MYGGVTITDVRTAVIDGIPTLYLPDGRGVPDSIIDMALSGATAKVASDLDVLIGVYEIRCIRDHSGEDALPDDVLLHPPLDKPRNWFQGDRNGALHLPYRPVKEVLSLTMLPYGWQTQGIPIPLDRFRLDNGKLQLVPGPFGFVLPVTSVFPSYQFQDGLMNPGSVEIIFKAGLSDRDLRLKFPLVKSLIQIQAAILALSMLQIRIGGGIAKEGAGADGQTNSVELGRIDRLGPLGGVLSALKANYNELLSSARAEMGSQISMVWL